MYVCRVWEFSIEAYDCGSEAAQWLSSYLGGEYRLVHHPDTLRGRDLNKIPWHWSSQTKDHDFVCSQSTIHHNVLEGTGPVREGTL